MYDRWRHHIEVAGAFPSCMLAYRREISGSHGAILLRQLVTYWSETSEVVMLDWDESNASCGQPWACFPTCPLPPTCTPTEVHPVGSCWRRAWGYRRCR